jgi:para-nitrobenzyl esterase
MPSVFVRRLRNLAVTASHRKGNVIAALGAIVAGGIAATVVILAGASNTNGLGAAAVTAATAPACVGQVMTADGAVCGLSVNGDTEYLGIPYAAPPVGNLRWQAPQPAAPFQTQFQATQLRPDCAGQGSSGSEDCLW